MAVYAAVAGNVTIAAVHNNPRTAAPVVVTFWRVLLNWVSTNPTGRVVGLTLAVLIGLLCCCCVCLNCRDSAASRKLALEAHRKRSSSVARGGGAEAYLSDSAPLRPVMMPVITAGALPPPPMLAAPTAAASMADRVREVRAQQYAALQAQQYAARVPPRR